MKLGALEICKATGDKMAQRLHLVKKKKKKKTVSVPFSSLCVCVCERGCVLLLWIKERQEKKKKKKPPVRWRCAGIIKSILTPVATSPSFDPSFLLVFLDFSKRQQFHRAQLITPAQLCFFFPLSLVMYGQWKVTFIFRGAIPNR